MYHAVVRRRVLATFAALSRGNYEPALAGMAPRFEHIFAGSHPAGGTRHTPDAMRRWFERLFRLNHNLSFIIKHVAVGGPPWNTTAVVEWRDTAVLATGTDYVNDGVHVIRMRWGKVISLHAYLDTEVFATACRQMADAGITEASAAPIEG
jgi:ketosteroid isomerase-like protein